MIQFNLEKKWFDKIKSGEKKIEYREFKPYWIKHFEKIWGTIFWTAPIYFEDNTFPCILRLGYTKLKKLSIMLYSNSFLLKRIREF